jgi:hypothetical protein
MLFAQISPHPLGDPPYLIETRIRAQFAAISGRATEENRIKGARLNYFPLFRHSASPLFLCFPYLPGEPQTLKGPGSIKT